MVIDIDGVVQGYIEAMLWAESVGEDDAARLEIENWDKKFSASDLSEEAMAWVREVCEDFCFEAKPVIESCCDGEWPDGYGGRGEWTEEEQLGHDLFLSSGGHGAGFPDRDGLRDVQYNGPTVEDARYGTVVRAGSTLAEVLQSIAHGYPEFVSLYEDGGKLHVDGGGYKKQGIAKRAKETA